MRIDFHAFQNCVSLKELYFKELDKPVSIDILKDDNLPANFSIVVPDHIYEQQKKSMCHEIWYHYIKSHSMKNQDKLRSEIDNIDIYLAVAHLQKVKNINEISKLIQYFIQHYSLNDEILQKVKTVFKV